MIPRFHLLWTPEYSWRIWALKIVMKRGSDLHRGWRGSADQLRVCYHDESGVSIYILHLGRLQHGAFDGSLCDAAGETMSFAVWQTQLAETHVLLKTVCQHHQQSEDVETKHRYPLITIHIIDELERQPWTTHRSDTPQETPPPSGSASHRHVLLLPGASSPWNSAEPLRDSSMKTPNLQVYRTWVGGNRVLSLVVLR